MLTIILFGVLSSIRLPNWFIQPNVWTVQVRNEGVVFSCMMEGFWYCAFQTFVRLIIVVYTLHYANVWRNQFISWIILYFTVFTLMDYSKALLHKDWMLDGIYLSWNSVLCRRQPPSGSFQTSITAFLPVNCMVGNTPPAFYQWKSHKE